MKKIKYILIFIFILLSASVSYANDSNIAVRAGISDTNFKTYLFDTIEFNDAKNIELMDSATGYIIPKKDSDCVYKVTIENNLFRIYADDVLLARNLSGPVLVRPIGEENFISIKGLKRKGKQALYRGYIELTRSSKDITKFSIVNVLSLNNYLRGVVPNEMPVRFGLEALKSQTVAARNYAVAPRIKAYKEFDLCDSVACQVYYGANTENDLSDKAIEETDGIIALDSDNTPILALYSSTAGGYTESYEYAFSDPKTREFPSSDIPYLSSVPDKKEFEPLNSDEKAEKFYTSAPEAFDDNSPYYRWSKEWSVEELEKVLSKTLIAQSATGFISPKLLNESDFGKLLSIKALKRGNSGKIIELEITTDKNVFNVKKELVIRRCFQKNGISLPSANFVINYIDSQNPVYKFYGGGFGHGVGLSQWGAGKMASLGYKFDEILQHYYKGIKLSSVPQKIYMYKTYTDKIYYSDGETADLVIKNPYKLNNLKVKINDKELEIKLKSENKPINISKYFEKGINNISYTITDEEKNLGNYVEIFIIVKEAVDE